VQHPGAFCGCGTALQQSAKALDYAVAELISVSSSMTFGFVNT